MDQNECLTSPLWFKCISPRYYKFVDQEAPIHNFLNISTSVYCLFNLSLLKIELYFLGIPIWYYSVGCISCSLIYIDNPYIISSLFQ